MPTGVYIRRHSLSEEARRKIGEATSARCLGKPFSDERRSRHAEALIGHPVSDSTRAKLSAAMRILPIPKGMNRLGKKWSEKSRRAWSQKQKGVKRKPHTFASRRLMSERLKARMSHRPKAIDESKSARKGVEYWIWRDTVYRRDDFTCQKCFGRGGHLHPHHLENFASNIALRYDPENGVTCCVECHKAFHKRFGKKRNNREQWLVFTNQVAEKT